MVYAGRIAPSKNLLVLLEALELIAQSGSATSVMLDVYGPAYDAKYFTLCLEKIATLPNVAYRGCYSPGDDAALRAASFLVQPSYREGESNVVNEALACGTPVIGSNIPGVRRQVAATDGYLIGDQSRATSVANSILRASRVQDDDYMRLSRLAWEYAAAELSEDREIEALAQDILAPVTV